MVTYGVGVIGEHDPGTMLRIAQTAEYLGYERLWIADERFFQDVWTLMGWLAGQTTRIGFGTSVTDPFVRHPALTANAIATADNISGSRCVLGIGAGISGFAEMGINRHRPARAIREAVEIMRGLWDGERVSYNGQIIRLNDGALNWRPARRVPVYIAGRGPKILEMGGFLGDGVIIGSFASQGGIEYAKAHIEAGAKRAGRNIEDIPLVSWCYTSVSHDGQSAREAVRSGVSTAIWGSKDILDQIGIEVTPEHRALMEQFPYTQDPEIMGRAAQMISGDLIRDFSISGTPEDCAEKIVELTSYGISHIAMWIFPPVG